MLQGEVDNGGIYFSMKKGLSPLEEEKMPQMETSFRSYILYCRTENSRRRLGPHVLSIDRADETFLSPGWSVACRRRVSLNV